MLSPSAEAVQIKELTQKRRKRGKMNGRFEQTASNSDFLAKGNATRNGEGKKGKEKVRKRHRLCRIGTIIYIPACLSLDPLVNAGGPNRLFAPSCSLLRCARPQKI